MDLLTLIRRDTPVKKVSSTAGGEWAGPCPFCGGQDRFRVQPERGRWWCRQCSRDERWEDAIAYLQRRDGMSFQDARQTLNGMTPLPSPPVRRAPEAPTEPPPRWQQAAAVAVGRGVDRLWSDAGSAARRWLHARGLTEDTLMRWLVGFSPGERMDTLWVPHGIVIPWCAEQSIWQLKVRRPRRAGSVEPKYVSVRGGRPHLYGVDRFVGRPYLVLTEGEFDAMLLWQHVHDIADVGTLGSCGGTPTERVLWHLTPYRTIFLAHDADKAGEECAIRLRSLSGRLRRIRPVHGKDITDFHCAGGSIRSWLEYHISVMEAGL